MSNYTKLTNFTAKDTLPDADPNKIVLGEEIDIELSAIQTAVNSKTDKVSGGTDGNLVSRDASGNLQDAGITPSEAQNSWQELYSLSSPQSLSSAWQEDILDRTAYRTYRLVAIVAQTSGSTFEILNTVGGTPDGALVYKYASSVYALSGTPGPTITGSAAAGSWFDSNVIGTTTTQVFVDAVIRFDPVASTKLWYRVETTLLNAAQSLYSQYLGSSGSVDGLQIQGDANCTVNSVVVLGLRNS